MNFLELIRPHLCHDPDCKSIVVLSNQPPAIRCEMCQQMPILNVYHFIREAANVDLLGASHLAQMYYVLTGDEHGAVPFALVSVWKVFYLNALCYACCCDIGMVANWALGLMALIRRDLYYVMPSIQKGEGIVFISENFAKYGQLEKMVKEKIQAPSDLVDMVSH
ncbi:hypothetical protein TNIN_263861 [Trichonephila inaurata madagascariensis]|uniref:Uncharacterized protein n=1 Tax=Trichonephila inaurata madagascariensis TaxID=2747483 RepID=A0A8X6YC01_9ARAC|nr:hypothetical protein TNIN_263861 [Trichonephila inaurata madagascariensis]